MIIFVLFFSLFSNAGGPSPRYNALHAPVKHSLATQSQFKSYKEWKNDQMSYWKARGQAEMAKDLTVADYFAGYLTKQRDQSQAIRDVSARLSADEVAELMTVYANSVFGSHTPQLPARAEKQP